MLHTITTTYAATYYASTFESSVFNEAVVIILPFDSTLNVLSLLNGLLHAKSFFFLILYRREKTLA